MKPATPTTRSRSRKSIASMHALLAAGLPQREVARRLGLSESTVSRAVMAAGGRSAERVVELSLTPSLDRALEAAALRYGKSPQELLTSVLYIVIADNLFEAVIG